MQAHDDTTTPTTTPTTTDGRRARRGRGRLAVCEAMIDLVFEGNLPPSADQVAERAGYSSAEEFVKHLLEKAVSDVAQAATDEEVEKQLRGLGYIE